MTREEMLGRALIALGEAYRGNWTEFDGRTLREELGVLGAYLLHPELPFDLNIWYVTSQICPISNCWAEHCFSTSDSDWCAHLEELWPRSEELWPRSKAASDSVE